MTPEEKLNFQKNAIRLLECSNISDTVEMLNILSECLFKMFYELRNDILSDKTEADARIIIQMLFSKLLNLTEMLEGVNFQSKESIRMNTIIDPTVIGVLVRNIYETVAMFNVVYVNPKQSEEKLILYNLWVIAGLKYRQRFQSKATTIDNTQKQLDEAKTIIEMTNEIEQTYLYQSMDIKNQGIIKINLDKKEYKINIQGNTVKSLSWQEIASIMGLRKVLADDMYTYLSLYSHPSNVSVFQFGGLFNNVDSGFISMTNFNVRYAIMMITIFVYDYIKLFPNTMKSFNSLSMIEQVAINFHSQFAREDKGVIK